MRSVGRQGRRSKWQKHHGPDDAAAGQGSKLHIRCEGDDAGKAMREIEELIKAGFNED
jgi:hypothetical protein